VKDGKFDDAAFERAYEEEVAARAVERAAMQRQEALNTVCSVLVWAGVNVLVYMGSSTMYYRFYGNDPTTQYPEVAWRPMWALAQFVANVVIVAFLMIESSKLSESD